MEKIEKLEEFNWVSGRDAITIALCNTIIRKQNEIIDHLNSQDQEEENTVCEGCGKTIASRFMQSYTKGDGMHSYCLSCDPEKQDTPEEWEKEFELPDEIEHEDCIEVLADKHKLWEICSWEEPELDPDKVVTFIKQLLVERERWAIDTFLKDTASYNSFHNGRPRTMKNGLSGEGFEVRVSKLTTK